MDYKELVNLCEEVCDNMERAYDRKMDECKLMGDYLRVLATCANSWSSVTAKLTICMNR